jgi:arylsulfatase
MMRAVLLPLLASLALACSKAPQSPARRVIVITCDTLRADHLRLYGHRHPTSPCVDAFAKDGVTFLEAWTTIPVTGPALSALWTGKLPDELGLSGGNTFLLGADAVTLAEIARDAGVTTAAIVSNWVLRKPDAAQGDVGVQQGFRHFDDRMEEREGNRPSFERRAPETAKAAIGWLEEQKRSGDDRFLLWVHFQDPHGPYVPPEEALADLDRPPTLEAKLPVGKTRLGRGQIPHYQVVGDERRPEDYRKRYDGEVRWFDTHFGKLVEWLRANEWYDDALVVLTADHGEALGEHNYWFCHGENVHREAVRVPLVVKYPAGAPRPIAPLVRELVTHLDLWPTVLDALALKGASNRGTSLLATTLPKDRIAAHVVGAPNADDRWVGASDGRYHLVVQKGEAPKLYDNKNDAAESFPLASPRAEVALEQAAIARGLMERLVADLAPGKDPPPRPARLAPSSENVKALQHTGYAGDDEH